ncbi:sensor histidine kinase [Slackia heliotrinireducens]|uniref:sensor histidine kinase n=1 Tax=Slackia heliotrinireducens TaxID=84110 RepID=UPI003315E813
MHRLQTYLAILATLFTATGTILLTMVSSVIDLSAFETAWFILLICTVTFAISLVIGHYLVEPLKNLHLKAQTLLGGVTDVSFQPEGTIAEADMLARDFHDLSEKTSQQMADLSVQQKRQTQFISDVAHELRTPLTAIRGNAETLADPDMPQDLRERFTHTIVSEAERLTRLTNDLLTLQHIEDGSEQQALQRVNLRTIATDVADVLETLVEDRNGTIEVVGEAPDVLGNPDRLQQAIYNLVANACRFIGDGGHIVIRLEGVDDKTIVSVIDDGPGFGDTDPNMLFSRFYRGDNSRARNTGGTGLGLAIVKSVVEAHDGTVQAFNVASGGACFMIALPSVH